MLRLWCVAVAFLVCVVDRSWAIKGIDFTFKSKPDEPRAVLTNPSNGLPNGTEQFTFCVLLYMQSGKNQQPVNPVSYSSRDSDNTNEILLEMSYGRSYTSLYIHSQETLIDIVPASDEWVHVCAMWDSDTGQADFYFNGIHAGTGKKQVMQGHKIGGTGFLVLGQDQDWFDGGYDADNGVNGRITQFHFWDRVLDVEEVKNARDCELVGNVVEWDKTSWRLSGKIGIEATTAPCYDGNYYNLDPCSDGYDDDSEEKETGEQTGYGKHNQTETEGDCGRRRHPLAFDLVYPPKHDGSRAVLIHSPLTPPNLKELTYSFWLFLDKPRGDVAVAFAYNSAQGVKEMGMEFKLHTFQTSITIGGREATFSALPPQREWTHLTVTWSGVRGGKAQLFLNGSSVATIDRLGPNYTIRSTGTLIVGQEHNLPVKEAVSGRGMEGRITDLFVWDRVLTRVEVSTIAKCSSANIGNVVNWNKARWEFEDSIIYERSTLTCE